MPVCTRATQAVNAQCQWRGPCAHPGRGVIALRLRLSRAEMSESGDSDSDSESAAPARHSGSLSERTIARRWRRRRRRAAMSLSTASVLRQYELTYYRTCSIAGELHVR
jgi:hypothetical protein